VQTIVTRKNLRLSTGNDVGEWDSLVQDAPAMFSVEYDYEPEQRAIVTRAPEDCQPGWPASVTLQSVTLIDGCVFNGDISKIIVFAGKELLHLLERGDLDSIEDEALADSETNDYDYEPICSDLEAA
jgi:hypothetical protein